MTLVLLRSSGMVPTRTARRCWQLPRQLQRPSQAHLLETKTSINQSICSRGAHLPWKYMFRYLSISAPCLARRNRTPGQPTHTRDDENLRGTESDNGGSTHVTDEQRDLIARELALMLGVSDAEARAMIEDGKNQWHVASAVCLSMLNRRKMIRWCAFSTSHPKICDISTTEC